MGTGSSCALGSDAPKFTAHKKRKRAESLAINCGVQWLAALGQFQVRTSMLMFTVNRTRVQFPPRPPKHSALMSLASSNGVNAQVRTGAFVGASRNRLGRSEGETRAGMVLPPLTGDTNPKCQQQCCHDCRASRDGSRRRPIGLW